MTQAEAREKWVAALRSGRFTQAHGQLYSSELGSKVSYCCLGVACEVAIQNGLSIKKADGGYVTPPMEDFDDDEYDLREEDDGVWDYTIVHDSELPLVVAEWLGVDISGDLWQRLAVPECSSGVAQSLINLNDDAHYDFNQIADVIESGNVRGNG